jgi:hypothetical protein
VRGARGRTRLPLEGCGVRSQSRGLREGD